MKCGSCGRGTMARVESEMRRTVAGHTFSGMVGALQCKVCSAEEIELDEAKRFERAIAGELAGALPSGQAIQFIRKVLGYTAAELASLFGVRPETVSRWETDKNPIDRAAWTLFALLLADQRDTEAALRAAAAARDLPKLVKVA